jgi:hypothetical protein
MWQLITEHIRTSAAVGIGGLLLLLWRSGVIGSLWRSVAAIIKTVRDTELRGARRECEQLKKETIQLKADLLQEVRTNLAYTDINAQDTATIRALVRKIDEHNAAHRTLADERLCLIDYSGLFDEIKRALKL